MATKKLATTNEKNIATPDKPNVDIATKPATNAKSINDFSRADLGLERQFRGLKSQAISGTSIILPTTDAENFDMFYCVDSKDFYMFYNGTWYKQN